MNQRTYLIVAAVLFGLGFGSAVFYSSTQVGPPISAERAILNFLKTSSKYSNSVYNPKNGVIDGFLPNSTFYPQSDLRLLRRFEKTCLSKEIQGSEILSSNHEKLKVYSNWVKSLCTKDLDKFNPSLYQFFHPFGGTYAYHIYTHLPEDEKYQFLKNNQDKFHILELSDLSKKGIQLQTQKWDPIEYKFSLDVWARIDQKEPLIFFEKGALVLQKETEFISNKYLVIEKDELNKYFNGMSWKVVKGLNERCEIEFGTYCLIWIPPFNIVGPDTWLWISILFFVFGTFILIYFIILSVRLQSRLYRRQKFILQMLSHEFRTPITSMGLTIEKIRNRFDLLNETEKDLFISISNDFSKLSRIINASEKYATSDNINTLIVPHFEKIESINTFIYQILENQSYNIEYIPLTEDLSFYSDPFWLGFCLKNLAQNAIQHGKPPLRIKVFVENSYFSVSVSDGGMEKLDLDYLISKRSSDKGLGIGLSLVKEVMEILGGKLELKSEPTVFSLKLKRGL